MKGTIILYGVALAIAATGLLWLNNSSYWTELYIFARIGFNIALGSRAGRRLTWRSSRATGRPPRSASRRAIPILALLASGQSIKEMARALGISPNTVKTHVARVYEKLEVQKRIQAVEKARWLALIP